MACAPLEESLRRSYLLEMGVEVYLPVAAFAAAAASTAVRSEPSRTAAQRPPPQRASRQADGVAVPPPRRFIALDETGAAAPRPAAAGQQAKVETSATECLRCFGSVGATLVLALQVATVPRSHPLSLEYRRSLGALLEALELNQDRVFVICFNDGVDVELLRTSVPPAGRLTLGFALADRFAEVFGEDLLRLDEQLPPARANGAWKRRIWPGLRRVRKRLGLRVGP